MGVSPVVVAIDEESYRAAPFKGSPTLTWTNEKMNRGELEKVQVDGRRAGQFIDQG